MASQYGGQAGMAFANGVQQGYGFVDKAYAAEQEARAKEERIKTAVTKNKLLDIAYDNVSGKSAQEQKMQSMEQEITTMKEEKQKSDGVAMSADINGLASQYTIDERADYLTGLKEKITSNPSMYSTLGIKDPKSMSVLNTKDPEDMKWMNKFMSMKGVSPEELDIDIGTPEGQAEWNKVLNEAVNIYPVVKVDGAPVDMMGLGVATGAYNQASPKMRKQMEKNDEMRWDSLEEIVQRGRMGGEKASLPVVQDENQFADNPRLDELSMKYDTKNQVFNGTKEEEAEFERLNTESMNRANGEGSTPMVEFDASKATTGGPEDIATTEQADKQGSQEVSNYNDYLATIDTFETDGTKDRYTQKNPNSTAYGRGQVVDKTNAAIAKRLGLTPDQARTRDGQDMVLKELYKDFTNTLDKAGLPKTRDSYYALHQMGEPVGTKYLKGNIDSSVIKAMRGQFKDKGKGISDQDIVTKWENRFTKEGNSKVVKSAYNNYKAQTGTSGTAPMSDMRMRKVYALLGVTYPKDPNAPTTKMKNYDFLTTLGVEQDDAVDMVFGRTKGNTIRNSQWMKLHNEQKQFEPGSKEWDQLETAKAGESSKYFNTTKSKDRAHYDAIKANPESTPEQIQLAEDGLRKLDQTSHVIDKNYDTMKTAEVISTAKTADFTKPSTKDDVKLEATAKNDPKIYNSHVQKAEQQLNDSLSNLRGINRVQDLMSDKGYDSGMLDTAMNYVSSILPDAMAKKTDAQILADSGGNILTAQIVKELSGLQATDTEFARTLRNTIGDTSMQPSEKVKIIQNYIRGYNTKLRDQAKALGEKGLVDTAKNAYSQLDDSTAKSLGIPTRKEWIAKFGNDDDYDGFVAKKKGI